MHRTADAAQRALAEVAQYNVGRVGEDCCCAASADGAGDGDLRGRRKGRGRYWNDESGTKGQLTAVPVVQMVWEGGSGDGEGVSAR